MKKSGQTIISDEWKELDQTLSRSTFYKKNVVRDHYSWVEIALVPIETLPFAQPNETKVKLP